MTKKKRKKIVSKEPTSKIIKEEVAGPTYTTLNLKWKGIITLIFVALSFVLYHQSIQYGYVLDDQMVIVDNSYTKSGLSGISKIFSSDSFEGYFGKKMDLVEGGRYRPISLVSFAIEYELFGLQPGISHAINILLYGLSAFLLLIFLRRLFRNSESIPILFWSIPFICSAIFLFHPIHTEAVANIKGRDEILSFIFSLLAAHCSLKYIDSKKIVWLGGMLISFFIGLLSKENTITFLAIIPFGILLFRRAKAKELVPVVGLLLAVTLAYLLIRFQIIGYLLSGNEITDVMNNPFAGMTSSQRYATICYTLLKYLSLNLIPFPLTHDYYPYHIPIMQWAKPTVILSVVLHLIIVGMILKFWKSKPVITYALGFYLIALSIVSNIVVSVGTFMNERFAFTASAGICLLIAWCIHSMLKKNKIVGFALIGLIIIGYSIISFTRIPAWESELSLNKAAIKVSKNSARANSFMATALFNRYKEEKDRQMRKDLLEEALPYAEKAVEMIPSYANANLMVVGIAAEQFKMDGSLDDLLKRFKPVILRRPEIGFITEFLNYLNNRADAQTLIDFYYDVGFNGLINNQRRYDWGVHFLKMAYQLDPDNLSINQALNRSYLAVGNQVEAQKYLK